MTDVLPEITLLDRLDKLETGLQSLAEARLEHRTRVRYGVS